MVSVDLDFQSHKDLKSSCLEIGLSAADEHALKVRKPYTITKQRERWSEEEHNKFLEALQLYGRAWRRIEEHIGTKNAVQIRSHAQKFFSKVVRQSANTDSVDNSKAIEIPPPRPKRKPMHPYPRKLGSIPSKGAPVLKPLLKPLPRVPSQIEMENGSPTSVLSVVGSNAFQKNSLSAIPSAAGPTELGSGVSAAEEQHEMDLDEPKMASQVVSSNKTRPQTLKLFGKTLMVGDSEKRSPPSVSSSTNSEDDDGRKITVQSNPFQLTLRTSGDKGAAADFPRSSLNSFSGVPVPVMYYYPSANNQTTDLNISHQLYGASRGLNLGEHPVNSTSEAVCNEEMQGEGSWTGSNTASVSGVGVNDQNSDVVDSEKTLSSTENQLVYSSSSMLKQSEKSAFKSWKSSSEEETGSFKRYKTCINGEWPVPVLA